MPEVVITGADPPLSAIPDSPSSLFGRFGLLVGGSHAFVAHSHCDVQREVAPHTLTGPRTDKVTELLCAVSRETP